MRSASSFPNMTLADYRSQIAASVANAAVNQLINELAAKCVQVDELQAKVADLEQKLNPAPEASA